MALTPDSLHNPSEEDSEYCHHSPMLKTAQFTSYRLVHRTPSHFHPTSLNLSRTIPLTHKQNFGTEGKASMEYKNVGNRKDQVPAHEGVFFKGLMSEKRSFGDFRTVLHTGLYSQVVAMEVPVNGEIGDEVHTVDQILLFTSGKGLATIAGKDTEVNAGDVVVVPAGTQHQFVTRGDQPLELITVYAPAEHLPSSVHKDKEIGDKEEEDGIDEAPAWSQRSKKENEDKGLVKESGKYDE